MGKKLIIANWKMNLTTNEGSLFVHRLDSLVPNHQNVEVVIAPTLLSLQPLHLQVQHHHFNLAAQNFYWRDSGAYTGEVSAAQLHGLVKYVLVGHSERRHIFGEHDKDIRAKVQAAYRNGIIPVLCVGETLQEHTDGETNDVLHDQLVGGLTNITSDEAEGLVIAYEPVWAISDGKNFAHHVTATPKDASQAAQVIRRQITHLFGEEVAKKIRVIYGGSSNPDNAAGFLAAEGIDGLLVGGASLEVHSFAEIINKAHQTATRATKKRKGSKA